MAKLGKHYLVEYYKCNAQTINDEDSVRLILLEAARRSGATILESSFHKFSPHGVSGVVVIAESHISIHTWPEYNYAAVDIFTCGTSVNPAVAYNFMKESFSCEEIEIQEILRGEIPQLGKHISSSAA